MKARKVKRLDPAASLTANAERIVRVRRDELRTLAAKALKSGKTKPLHDTRIAAKRLRYVLEVTGLCFGPSGQAAAKRARELQDLLGEIHDCDELVPRMHALLDEYDAAEVEDLKVLAAWVQARRKLLYERFREKWGELEREGRLHSTVTG
jgi:CHAD domain-containing protein